MSFRKEIPSVIGNYVLHQPLGRGSFGSVKLANNMFKNEVVACKQIKNQSISDREKETIKREIEMMKKIHHENIILFLSVVEDFDFTNIFMEYVPGGTLRDYIEKREYLKGYELKSVFTGIHKGVHYLHQIKIIHRDLKPRNILMTTEGDPKIGDFGLSRHYEENEKISEWCGTLHYRAPETLKKEAYIGPEIDMWSLGVILYEMSTGKRPFFPPDLALNLGMTEEEQEERVQTQILKGEYILPRVVSPSLEGLIKGLLTLDPKNRYSSKEVLASGWFLETTAEGLEKSVRPATSNPDVPLRTPRDGSFREKFRRVASRLVKS